MFLKFIDRFIEVTQEPLICSGTTPIDSEVIPADSGTTPVDSWVTPVENRSKLFIRYWKSHQKVYKKSSLVKTPRCLL